MEYIETLGANAKAAEPAISVMGTNEKNRVLSEISSLLRSHVTEIIGANKLDIETARANGMSEAMIDRLTLTEQRIGGMADGVDKVISLPDPVGAVIGGSDLPNGLHVIKKRVPIGTIGIIFESRPNVTVGNPLLQSGQHGYTPRRKRRDKLQQSACRAYENSAPELRRKRKRSTACRGHLPSRCKRNDEAQ